jgi:hypothetical protein
MTSDLLQFLHVVSAFMFVTGIVGRDIVLGRARRVGDVEKVKGPRLDGGAVRTVLGDPRLVPGPVVRDPDLVGAGHPGLGRGHALGHGVTGRVPHQRSAHPPDFHPPREGLRRRARVGSVERTDHVRALRSPSRPGGRDGTLVGGRNDRRRPPVDGDETVLTPMDGSIRSGRSPGTSIWTIWNEL